MTSDNINVLAPILWVVGGFFLGVVLLAAMFGGFVLLLMMLAVVLIGAPFGLAGMAAWKLWERRTVPALEMEAVAVGEALEAPAPIAADRVPTALPREVSAAHVSVRVVEAQGTCPLGFTFHAGDEFVFTNGTVAPQLCGRADKALRPLIEQLRAGDYHKIELPYCQTKQHLVVFELEKARVAEPVSQSSG